MLNSGRILMTVLCYRIQLYLPVATHGHSTRMQVLYWHSIGSLGCGSCRCRAPNLKPVGEWRPLRLAGSQSIRNSFRQFD